MFSVLRAMFGTVVTLALCDQTSAFVSPPPHLAKASRIISSAPSSTTTAAARMSATTYAPANVQAAWDNHLAAFGGRDVDTILLDYDENSVIMTYDQKTNEQHTYKGVEGARTLFTGLFKVLSDMSDLSAPLLDVSEDPKMVFIVWRCLSSGMVDAADTFLFGANNKIVRQNVVFRAG